MSRDIGAPGVATMSPGRLGPRPSAGVSSLVAPIGLVGLDAVERKDLARVEGNHADRVLVDDGQDASTGMGSPDPQVMQAAGPAQGHPAAEVDAVVAQSEEARRATP